ncbi:uncharacterized protein LY89DRAFT_22956 [Mollisia scopiformis]|uniref:Uncharacterized protein n=1 Tax=Mollisia scopiformis TaxID=149040 RepID=A0A194XWE6_MOLSC|nr:uncharacterized protein LY89DRAFT_22956 [Mollisia scopiformis]KUJ24456.1 hypothetical protein LY89DRAFT_22956 [Mollisia scopiformis]
MFRVLITPFSPRGEMSPHKQEARWNPVNSGILNSPRSIHHSDQQGHVILESTPGPLYAHQRRLSGQSPSLPNSAARTRPVTSHRQHENSTMNNSARLDSGLRRNSFEPNHAAHEAGSQQSQRPHSLPSSSPHMGSTRTTRDQAMLRERASAYLIDRRDLELLSQESTVLDKLPYKTGAEVCGVVVDRRSGKGMVAITGKGYITLNVKTGPDESGDRYQDIAVQPKQTCMLHGEAVVLFYKRRQIQPEPPPQPPPFPSENHSQLQRPSTASDVDIIIRLQMDGSGKYSPAFDKSVLRPNRITTIEFFSWFASQSGHCPPQGPPYLKFTFKDAMPAPTSTEIVRGNEDHFNYMRKDIKIQCEKAKKYMADVKEFVILVTVPGWNTIDEEEEW